MSAELSTINIQLSTEQQVRAMRDRVFEKPSSNSNWFAAREYWMLPDGIRWLREKAEVLKTES